MTTVATPSAAHRTSRLPADVFAGTGVLVRLALRRERVPLLVGVVGLVGTVLATVAAFAQLYPDEAERVALARGVATTPAVLVLTGPVPGTSVGALAAWRLGVLGAALVALLALLTVVRRTRGDEEAGRTELLAAGVTGRLAPLAAAVAVAAGASLAIGLLVTAGAIGLGQDVLGSVCFGAALASTGWVFTGIAAVTAQLVDGARSATALAGTVLAVAYALRAAGDVAGGAGWLTWMSPLGWVEHVAPYGADELVVTLLAVVTALVGLAVAGWLLLGRDLGLGLWPSRLGPATGRLRTATGLALRLQRGPLLGWATGFLLFGAVVGALADDVGTLVEGNPQMARALEQLGGSTVLTDAFLAAMAGFLGLLAGVQAVAAAAHLRSEETATRLEPLLATALSRRAWLGGHLLVVVGGPVLSLALAGTVTGVVHAARSSGDPLGRSFGGTVADALSAALVQAPAAVLLGALAVALFGWLPRAMGVAWAAVGLSFLLGQLGGVLRLPDAVVGLSPFAAVPALPAESLRWTPLLVLTLLAVGLLAAGTVGFRRRDVG